MRKSRSKKLGAAINSYRVRIRCRFQDTWCSAFSTAHDVLDWLRVRVPALSWLLLGEKAQRGSLLHNLLWSYFGNNQPTGEWKNFGANQRPVICGMNTKGWIAYEQVWRGFCLIEFSRLNGGNPTQFNLLFWKVWILVANEMQVSLFSARGLLGKPALEAVRLRVKVASQVWM